MKLKRRSIIVLAALLLGLLAGGGWWWQRSRTPELVWTAINVNYLPQMGEGDAHLLQINRTNFFLIDTGHSLYAPRLMSFLKEQGVRRLNAIIISHGHSDHYGGLIPLLRSTISVERVYFNPPPPELVSHEWWGCSADDLSAIQSELSERNIPLMALTDQTRWTFENGITLQALYAYDGINTPIGRTDINDTSAILLLTHRRLRYLFTGDLNQALGRYITAQNAVVPLQADILKVPHHGAESLPDNDFFEAVRPAVMVVSGARGLWLSERCQRVRLRADTCPTFVTGLHGDIVVESSGYSYWIKTRRHQE